MNGAEQLIRTLVAGGIKVCFANPGTSEMHFCAALDRVEGLECVLGLFEGRGRRRLCEDEGRTSRHSVTYRSWIGKWAVQHSQCQKSAHTNG